MTDQRRFSRVPFDADTRLIVGSENWTCHLIDISVKGALLELPADKELERGAKAVLELRLSGGDVRISMKVTAAHHTGRKIGCYCDEIDADSMTHLRRLVELNLGDPNLIDRELQHLGQFGAPDSVD